MWAKNRTFGCIPDPKRTVEAPVIFKTAIVASLGLLGSGAYAVPWEATNIPIMTVARTSFWGVRFTSWTPKPGINRSVNLAFYDVDGGSKVDLRLQKQGNEMGCAGWLKVDPGLSKFPKLNFYIERRERAVGFVPLKSTRLVLEGVPSSGPNVEIVSWGPYYSSVGGYSFEVSDNGNLVAVEDDPGPGGTRKRYVALSR